MGRFLVRAFGYTVVARFLDNSEEMVREGYSYVEADEIGDVAIEVLSEMMDRRLRCQCSVGCTRHAASRRADTTGLVPL
jgi:hypothetical protein